VSPARKSAPAVRLVAIDGDEAAARAEVVAFVNRHYPSELPLSEKPLAAGLVQFFWAIDDEVAPGARVGCTAYMPKTAYLAESVKTVVDPAFRGRGYGEAISLAIEDEVRRRGFKKIMSTILVTNLPMIFIKLKQGFLVEGIHMDHEKPGLHEYSLGKVFREEPSDGPPAAGAG
jgi:GNAT superfamily N-acetyltransferase